MRGLASGRTGTMVWRAVDTEICHCIGRHHQSAPTRWTTGRACAATKASRAANNTPRPSHLLPGEVLRDREVADFRVLSA